jgi:hypothetical protein
VHLVGFYLLLLWELGSLKLILLNIFLGTLLYIQSYLKTDWASNILRDYVGVAMTAYLKHQDTEHVWASGTQIYPVNEIPSFTLIM